MKTFYTMMLLSALGGFLYGQMEPGSYAISPDLSGTQQNSNNANKGKKVRSSKNKKARDSRDDNEEYGDEEDVDDRPTRRGSGGGSGVNDAGEPENPRLLGMEMPLLDPSSDTVTYNGGKFDVGNNAIVRARFEKYLQQNPDDSTEAKRYRQRMNDLLKLTQNNARQHAEVGSQTLLQIGRGLYEINDYSGDAGQAATLASAIASALSVQYANRDRERKNEQLTEEIDKLVRDTNIKQTRNENRPSKEVGTGRNRRRQQDQGKSNSFLIAEQTAEIATKKGSKVKNDADSVAATELAKVNYQGTLISFLVQRRFEHALIGSFAYRHIFRDGDNKLNIKKDSQAAKVFEGGAGVPPTVGTISSLAANARREVDQNMEAVNNLLAQNKMAEATQHLIEAVAIGEYMPSVCTFPTESRRRIAEFWTLRKRSLSALNARDYGTLEEIADKMKELDVDFDDSLLRTYCEGRKMQSDMALRNARKAFMSGDEEAATEYAEQAALIWPRNPNLKEMQKEVMKLDNNDAVITEFKTLLDRHQYRTIYNERSKFKVVAIDPELEKKYEESVMLIGTIDAMLQQIDVAASQDKQMGPCMAYEMLLDFMDKDSRYMEDPSFKDAVVRFKVEAQDFVKALEAAKEQEDRREFGSALANYYRAQCLCLPSNRAKEGIERLSKLIMSAQFPQ